jgi:hypothetical protein
MPEPFILALPCKVVTLQFTVAGEQGMTNLEEVCARAVLAGIRTAKALAELFRVPERLIIDIVSSLWSKGYLSFDFLSGDLDLTEAAVREFTAASPPADSAQVVTRKFVYEPISKRLLLAREREIRHRPPPYSDQLPLRGRINPGDLPQEALAEGVQAAIARERQRGFNANVLRVSVSRREFSEPEVIQWVALEATVIRDAQTGRLRISLNDYGWESAAPVISGYVADLVETEPETKLAKSLIERADPAIETAIETAEQVNLLLDRMAGDVTAFATADRIQLKERQRVLVQRAERIRSRLLTLSSRRVNATCVRGVEGHSWAARYLIESSTRQIVLVLPEIAAEQFEGLVQPLQEALRRGVRLVVLWGDMQRSTLARAVRNTFADFASKYNQDELRVLIARESCRTDACLIIQDNRRALVGSYCVTRPFWHKATPVSVLLEEPADGPSPPEVVEDLLLWAQNELPYLQERKSVLTARDEFTSGTFASGPFASGARAAPVPGILRGTWPTLGTDDHPDDAMVRLLADQWEAARCALKNLHADLLAAGPEAGPVSEGEARTVSFDLIRAADRQVVLADDMTDPAAANSELARLLRARRKKNVAVHLIHPPLKAQDDNEPFGKLATGADRVTVRKTKGATRLLVADDEVIIGSCSLLGASAARFVPRYRRRSKISVRIRHHALATEIAAAQGVAVPAAPAPLPRALASPASGSSASQELLATLRGSSSGTDSVVDSMGALDAPWAVLAEWQGAGVPPAELRSVAAAMLRSDLPKDGCQAWARWLVMDAWQRAAWVEAALLAPLSIPLEPGLAPAAVLAASLEVGPLGTAASDAAVELAYGDSRELKIVGAVGGLADCLVWADGDGCDALELLRDALPPAWNALAETAINSFKAQDGRLPLGSLMNEQTRRDTLAGLDVDRKDLLDDIEGIRRLENRFEFPTGKALRRGLFSPEGLLTRIRAAALTDCAAFPPLADSLPRNVHDYLDEIIKEAGETPMSWGNQMSFLRNIEGFVRRARHIAAVAPDVLDPAKGMALKSGHVAIAQQAGRDLNVLLLEIGEQDATVQPPLRVLLSRLEPLAAWAGFRP